MRVIVTAAAAVTLLAALAACGSASKPAPRTATSPPVAAAAPPTAAIIARRLHLTDATVYTATTDPNHLLGRQHEYTSKVNWGPDLDNSIEVFTSTADAQAREQYVSSFAPPFGDGYDYQAGTTLLRLDDTWTPAQARAIAAAFRKAAQ